MRLDNYQYLGIGLISFGAPFTAYCYYILDSVPLAAFGLSCIILGTTLWLVPSDPISPLPLRAMLEGSILNIEALLEEFNVMGKAVYLPPRNERVAAIIPVKDLEVNTGFDKVPLRVLTRVGGVEAVLVFPPGSEIVKLALIAGDVGLEDALNITLVDFSEFVTNVKSVYELDRIIVELDGVMVMSDFDRVNHSLGSLVVSIAGCVISSVLGKCVAFVSEEYNDGSYRAVFRVLN